MGKETDMEEMNGGVGTIGRGKITCIVTCVIKIITKPKIVILDQGQLRIILEILNRSEEGRKVEEIFKTRQAGGKINQTIDTPFLVKMTDDPRLIPDLRITEADPQVLFATMAFKEHLRETLDFRKTPMGQAFKLRGKADVPFNNRNSQTLCDRHSRFANDCAIR